MSDTTGNQGAPSAQDSINRRAWSRQRQLRAVALSVAAGIGVILLFWIGGRIFGPHAAPLAALLNAEQSYQQAIVSLTQARTNRYADTAALFQALGGSIAPLSH